MNSIDLTPLYRNSIGYDRLASMLDTALNKDAVVAAYPPYNIEALDEDRYAITLAVAGFRREELDLHIERGVLVVRGEKTNEGEHKYLHQGIANRTFERKFNLADYVEVSGAELNNGLLTIKLVKEIPEAMKPRTIAINDGGKVLDQDVSDNQAADDNQAA